MTIASAHMAPEHGGPPKDVRSVIYKTRSLIMYSDMFIGPFNLNVRINLISIL